MPNGHARSDSRRALRYRLTLTLRRAGRPMTVAELVQSLEDVGWPAPEPANKTVSDCLRWELGHRRIVRVARGTYAVGTLDRRTAWWMKHQLEQWDAVPPRVDRFSESGAVPEPEPRPEPAAPRSPGPNDLPDWLAALRPPA